MSCNFMVRMCGGVCRGRNGQTQRRLARTKEAASTGLAHWPLAHRNARTKVALRLAPYAQWTRVGSAKREAEKGELQTAREKQKQ